MPAIIPARSRSCFALCAAVLLLAAAGPPAAAADPVLGIADDGPLVTNPVDPGASLDAGLAHGARFVRMIVVMHRHPDEDRYLRAAQMAAARGMGLDVVLSFRWAEAAPEGPVTPQVFADWAAAATSRFAALGAPLRVSLVNEPDLLVPAADLCDPETAANVVREAGYRTVSARTARRRSRGRPARSRARRAPRGSRRKARRAPRAASGTVVLRRARRAHRRHARRASKTVVLPGAARGAPAISVRRGCMSLQRARRVAPYLIAAIPAIRRAAPGVEVGAGETSPTFGLYLFARELARLGIPPIDRWAHHPYAYIPEGGRYGPSPPGWYGPDRVGELRALADAVAGRPVPIDVTEFGIKHSQIADLEERAAVWRRAHQQFCLAGVRSLVAYQWSPPDPPGGGRWDTSLLGPGLAETPEARQLPWLRCG